MYEQLNREVYAQKHGVVPKEEVASTVEQDIDTTASTTTQLHRSDSQVASPDNDVSTGQLHTWYKISKFCHVNMF